MKRSGSAMIRGMYWIKLLMRTNLVQKMRRFDLINLINIVSVVITIFLYCFYHLGFLISNNGRSQY